MSKNVLWHARGQISTHSSARKYTRWGGFEAAVGAGFETTASADRVSRPYLMLFEFAK